jgi:selenide,water dikinase
MRNLHIDEKPAYRGETCMETEVKLTKLASCAGCGAKVGAGTLAALLEGFKTHTDPRLIVGFDKSDDASVYVINEETAIVQTTDFFPPIVDDPCLFGQIAAANAISDIYAMGGEPKLALNIMCVKDGMDAGTVREILRGGYEKAYEAGVIISGGHTIHGAEPVYGLAVTGFAHPSKILTNSGARPGDVLILTKPLGVGIITTAAKAGLADAALLSRLYLQMSTLNKAARDIMVLHKVNSCTDVTGFALLGHSYEMAQGSGCTLHITAGNVPFHKEALEFADMGFIPAGAYRNREYAGHGVSAAGISRPMLDIMYDPQTSGGLLIAAPEEEAGRMLRRFADEGISASAIGYVTEKNEDAPYVVVE